MKLEVVSDQRVGQGGFLQLRRLVLKNRREDGSLSRSYPCDFIERPVGLDAVAVVLFEAGAVAAPRVLLRDALRPALTLGRPDGVSYWCSEVVAGLIENGDVGEDGLRRRAVQEIAEEAGYVVAPESVIFLGSPVHMSPGVIAERIWIMAVGVDPTTASAPTGDGSPMEESHRSRWLPLEAALTDCVDAKTEIALRRFRDHLAAAHGSPRT